jgi:hypothetical protein
MTCLVYFANQVTLTKSKTNKLKNQLVIQMNTLSLITNKVGGVPEMGL